jgi:hypothetical protein
VSCILHRKYCVMLNQLTMEKIEAYMNSKRAGIWEKGSHICNIIENER